MFKRSMTEYVFEVARRKTQAQLRAFEARLAIILTQHVSGLADEKGVDISAIRILCGYGAAKFGAVRYVVFAVVNFSTAMLILT